MGTREPSIYSSSTRTYRASIFDGRKDHSFGQFFSVFSSNCHTTLSVIGKISNHTDTVLTLPLIIIIMFYDGDKLFSTLMMLSKIMMSARSWQQTSNILSLYDASEDVRPMLTTHVNYSLPLWCVRISSIIPALSLGISCLHINQVEWCIFLFEQIYCKSIKHVSEDVAGHDVGNDFCWAPFWSPDHDYNDYHDDHDDDDIDHAVGNDFCWASFWSPEAQHVRLTWLWLATYNLDQPSGSSTLFFSSSHTSLIFCSIMRLRFKNILSPSAEKDWIQHCRFNILALFVPNDQRITKLPGR